MMIKVEEMKTFFVCLIFKYFFGSFAVGKISETFEIFVLKACEGNYQELLELKRFSRLLKFNLIERNLSGLKLGVFSKFFEEVGF